jgi:exodeoxyribonuclease VII large subunit
MRTQDARGRLHGATRRLLEAAGRRLEALDRALRAVGPQSTLERGYAIVATSDGDLVRSAAVVTAGQRLSVRVADGSFDATVSDD